MHQGTAQIAQQKDTLIQMACLETCCEDSKEFQRLHSGGGDKNENNNKTEIVQGEETGVGVGGID